MIVNLGLEASAQLRDLGLANRPLRNWAVQLLNGARSDTPEFAAVSALKSHGCPHLAESVSIAVRGRRCLDLAKQITQGLFRQDAAP